MFTVLIIMTLGIVIGAILKDKKKLIKISSKLTNWAIFILLFLLGVAVGTNKEILQNFDKIGYQAIGITIFAVLGSVLTASLTYRLFLSSKGKRFP